MHPHDSVLFTSPRTHIRSTPHTHHLKRPCSARRPTQPYYCLQSSIMSSSDVTYDMDTCKVCESQRSWFAKKMRSLAKATENSFCNFILLIPAPSAHPSVYTIGEFLPDMKSLDSNEKTAAARDHLASASGGGLMRKSYISRSMF